MNDAVKDAESKETLGDIARYCGEIHQQIYQQNKHIVFKMSERQAQEMDQAAVMLLDDIDADIMNSGNYRKIEGKGFWPRKSRGPLLRYFVELLTYSNRLKESEYERIKPLFDLVEHYTRIRIEIHNARNQWEMEQYTNTAENDYLVTLALRCETERMEDPDNKSIMASNQLKSDYLEGATMFANRFQNAIEQRPTIFKDARRKAFVSPPIQSFADLLHLYLYPTLKDPINTNEKSKAMDQIANALDAYFDWVRLRRQEEVFKRKEEKRGA